MAEVKPVEARFVPIVPVELVAHDPGWAGQVELEERRLRELLGETLQKVHHIGSTSIPGIVAKPILDLIPVVSSHDILEQFRPAFESRGFRWLGEYGLPGRRYITEEDPDTGRRRLHLHCYEAGNSEIDRHLAFRDYLRSHGDVAREYEALKRRCAAKHSDDMLEYSGCKDAWIRATERVALAWWKTRGDGG